MEPQKSKSANGTLMTLPQNPIPITELKKTLKSRNRNLLDQAICSICEAAINAPIALAFTASYNFYSSPSLAVETPSQFYPKGADNPEPDIILDQEDPQRGILSTACLAIEDECLEDLIEQSQYIRPAALEANLFYGIVFNIGIFLYLIPDRDNPIMNENPSMEFLMFPAQSNHQKLAIQAEWTEVETWIRNTLDFTLIEHGL